MAAFDPYEYPPEEQLQDLTSMMRFWQQVESAKQVIDRDAAVNAANFSRYYVTPSGELTAAVGLAKVPWNAPELSSLVERETEGGIAPFKWGLDAAKGTTRTIFNTIDSIQYQYRNKLPNMLVNLAQGEGLSFRESGLSPLGVARLAKQRGLPVTAGDGWLPAPTDPWDNPDYRQAYHEGIQEAETAGVPYNLEQLNQRALTQANVPIDAFTASRDLQAQQTFRPLWDRSKDVPVSWGRLFAGVVAPPDSLPFTVLSGGIDATTLIVTDPINPIALETTAAGQSRRLLIPEGAGNSAVLQGLTGNKWRPWVKKPDGAREWLLTHDEGQQLVRYIADSGPAAVARRLPDFPHETLNTLGKSNDQAQIIEELLPHLGVRNRGRKIVLTRKDRALGARTYFDPDLGAAGGWMSVADDTPRHNWWRRISATGEQGYLRIDPMDPNGTIKRVLGYMESVGADPGEIDEIVETITEAGTEFQRYGRVSHKIEDAIVHVLERKGADADFIRAFIREWEMGELTHKIYHQDEVGNVLFEMGFGPYEYRNSADEVVSVGRPSAIMESQFSSRNIFLPALRDVRQLTSTPRIWLWSKKLAPPGMEQAQFSKHILTWSRQKLDQLMGIWRTAALARLGWPLRVLPDEWMRAMASGYGRQFGNPFNLIAWQIGAKGNFEDVDTFSTAWDDWVEWQNGLGTGSPVRDIFNRPYAKDATEEFSASRVPWTVVGTRNRDGSYTIDGLHGLREQFLLMHNDRLQQYLWRNGYDDTYDYLLSPESRALRDEIADKADAGTLLHQLRGEEPSETAVREVLMRAQAHRAQYSGGYYYYKETGPDHQWTGAWVRSDTGTELNMWTINPETGKVYTNAELRAVLAEYAPDLPTSRLTKLQMRQAIFEQANVPWLDDLPADQRYFVPDDGFGSPRVQHFIYEGRDNWLPHQYADVADQIVPADLDFRNWLTEEAVEADLDVRSSIRFYDELREGVNPAATQAYVSGGAGLLDAELYALIDELSPDDWFVLGGNAEAALEDQFAYLQQLRDLRYDYWNEYVQTVTQPGSPAVFGQELLVGQRPPTQDVVRFTTARPRGSYVTESTRDALVAEGYVFYGGLAGRSTHVGGGITHDVTRAMQYASQPVYQGNGRVYVLKISDLPEQARRHLEDFGDIEYVVTKKDWLEWEHLLDEYQYEEGIVNIPEVAALPIWDDAPEWVMAPPREHFVMDEPLRYAETGVPVELMESRIERGILFDHRDRPHMITDDMTSAEHRALEEYIPRLFDENASPPATVPAADPSRTRRVASAYERAVNSVFWAIGGFPSQKFIRSPFFKVRYTEEMARWYPYADEPTRARILGLMDEVQVRPDFDAFLRRHMRNMGMDELPAAGYMDLDFDEFDELARAVSLDHVKNLMYDLSQSNNLMDAMRLFVPFGDAWWEVISRWAGLLNPAVNDGQALRNIRRPGQLLTNARGNGWFSEDQYGNEVFNLPVFIPGSDFRVGDFSLQPRAALEQFTFVDPGNPRSVILPGFGPLVQMPAALISYALPNGLGEFFDQAVYGNFQPANPSDLGDLWMSAFPTPWRRMIAAFFGDEFKEEYANDQVMTYNGLCMSNDSRFDCSTTQGQINAVNEANRITRNLSFLRILESVVYPAQPRHESMVTLYQHLTDTDDPQMREVMMSTSALAGEYSQAREYMGPDEAQRYMINRYGVDPVNLLPTTTGLKPRPYTREAFDHLEKHPALRQYADLTLVAFLPALENDSFYSKAWNVARMHGDRIPTSLDMLPQMQNEELGNRALFTHNELYEELTRTVKEQYIEYPATRQAKLEELRQWHNDEVDSIMTQYMEIDDDNNVVGRVQPAKAGDFLEEVMHVDKGIGVPGTDANRELKAVNPQLVGFLEFATARWQDAEDMSRVHGNRPDWWRQTEVTRILGPDEIDRAKGIRDWFTNELERYVAFSLTDPIARTGAQWFASRMFTPLLAGYDANDPLMIGPETVPDLFPDTRSTP